MRKTLSRVSSVAAVLALALSTVSCSSGEAPSTGNAPNAKAETTKVDFIIDYLWGTKHAGFIAADELGYYEEEGVDVTLHEGQGSSIASQLVASGDMDLGNIQPDVGVTAVSNGLKISTVMTLFPNSPFTIIYNTDRIQKADDLSAFNGHTIGIQEGSAISTVWPAVVEMTGSDVSDVKLENVGEQLIPSFRNGQVDAIFAFDYDQVSAIEALGMTNIDHLKFSDLGRKAPGAGVIVNNAFAEQNPEAVEGFVRATQRGWQWAKENPDKALEMFMKAQPRGDEEWEKRRLPMVLDSLGPADKIGAIDRERFQNLIDQYSDLGQIKTKPELDQVINDTFINKVLK